MRMTFAITCKARDRIQCVRIHVSTHRQYHTILALSNAQTDQQLQFLSLNARFFFHHHSPKHFSISLTCAALPKSLTKKFFPAHCEQYANDPRDDARRTDDGRARAATILRPQGGYPRSSISFPCSFLLFLFFTIVRFYSLFPNGPTAAD